MAARKESDMALVFFTRRSTRRWLRVSALVEAASNLAISCAWPAKARTTRMPPRFSSMTRVRTERRSWSSSQVARRREVHEGGAPGDEGDEAEREEAEDGVGGDEEPGAGADEDGQQHEADDAGGEEHAHALEVEHADGDEVARVHPVVEAEGEALDLLVEGEAELVTDVMAYGFAVVVLHHGEEAAQHADREEEERGGPEGVGAGAGEGLLALVDGAAEEARDGELQAGGDEGGGDGGAGLPGVAEAHAGDAHERVQPPSPAGGRHMGERVALPGFRLAGLGRHRGSVGAFIRRGCVTHAPARRAGIRWGDRPLPIPARRPELQTAGCAKRYQLAAMYFVSQNSRMPWWPPSRPRPLCLTPPNGAAGSETRPRLRPTMPASIRSETRRPRARSPV